MEGENGKQVEEETEEQDSVWCWGKLVLCSQEPHGWEDKSHPCLAHNPERKLE